MCFPFSQRRNTLSTAQGYWKSKRMQVKNNKILDGSGHGYYSRGLFIWAHRTRCRTGESSSRLMNGLFSVHQAL